MSTEFDKRLEYVRRVIGGERIDSYTNYGVGGFLPNETLTCIYDIDYGIVAAINPSTKLIRVRKGDYLTSLLEDTPKGFVVVESSTLDKYGEGLNRSGTDKTVYVLTTVARMEPELAKVAPGATITLDLGKDEGQHGDVLNHLMYIGRPLLRNSIRAKLRTSSKLERKYKIDIVYEPDTDGYVLFDVEGNMF